MHPNLTRVFVMVAVVLAALISPISSPAQQITNGAPAGDAADDLSAMATAAKEQFHPVPADRVPQARARLEKAIKHLDAYLATGSQQNTADWKAYLKWDEMLAELAKDEGPDPAQLAGILRLYYRNYTSLEHPAFAEMRAALLEYRTALVMAHDSRLEERYRLQLDRLAELLKQFEQDRTLERSRQIGALVGALEMAGQAEELVAAIRNRYGKPNLYTVVSQEMVNSGLMLDVAQSDDVRDCILGTSMVGHATMRGGTHVELLDNPRQAELQLELSGTIHSNNIGFNHGVKIYSEGETAVQGRKRVFIDAKGVTSGPSSVSCTTDSTINGITARSCLVERIAWRKAGRSKSQAEQIGSRHAEERVAMKMDERADEMLDQVNDDFQERFRKPLLRRDEFPQNMRFSTQGGRLLVTWLQANSSQLAAAVKPPPITGDHDLAVQLHESFVSNFSRAMIGGVRLSDQRLVEILEKNKIDVPEAVQLSEDKPSWAITFSSQNPLNATFSDNTLRFAIRGRKFELGERVVNKELEMSAVYQLTKTPAGARLTRQGDVSVEYVGVTGNIPTDEVIVRTVMRQKFEALFIPEFETTGIELPGRWQAGGKLLLDHIATQEHWLHLAWTQDASDR